MVNVGTLLTLSASVAVTCYLFYALVPVPADIEQGDDVFWIFVKRKHIRALSIIGEYLGLGHRINLTRYLGSTSFLIVDDPANNTDVKIRNLVFDGVPVRFTEPNSRVENSPALVWIHGGGWTLGSAESDEFVTSELSRRLQIPIVSINYRLAPENIFPASVDDCFTAVKHVLDNAKTYGFDAKRIAIGGSSSGGNLAAAVALKLRDLKLSNQPSLQVLFVPCLQAFDFNTPSYQTNTDNGFLPRYWMVNFWLWYAFGGYSHLRNLEFIENQHTSHQAKVSEHAKLVDHNLISRKYIDTTYVPNAVNFGNESLWEEVKDVFLNPYFAPLMARDLSGVPDAYIATAGWDVLRDDGLMYAKRLASAGVDVKLMHYQNGFHNLFIQRNHFKLSKTVMDDLVQYLAAKL